MTKSLWRTPATAWIAVLMVLPVPLVAQEGPASKLVNDMIAAQNRKREQERQDALVAAQVELMKAQAQALKAQAPQPLRIDSDEVIAEFRKKHPDYTPFIPGMACWSALITPIEGTPPLTYLEALLILAKAEPTCGK